MTISRMEVGTGGTGITPAQRRVLDLVCEGLTNAAIAERLHISKRTVETHVRALFRAYDVEFRGALIARALRSA